MASTSHGSTGKNVAIGSLAGLAATVPMTAVMEGLYRRLPCHERYPLYPRQITMEAAGAVGAKRHLQEPGRLAATLVAHFGMGAAAGALFGLVGPKTPLPRPVSGALHGLAVYGVNYLGWLPATGMLGPPGRRPLRRDGLLIAAHLAWGLSAGIITAALNRWTDREAGSAADRLREPVARHAPAVRRTVPETAL